MENDSKQEKQKLIQFFEQRKNIYINELSGLFKIYKDKVILNRKSTSFESICFLLTILDQVNPKTILDIGAGFNSAAIRWYYFQNKTKKLDKLLTIDTDPIYIKEIRKFCIDSYLPLYEVMVWHETQELEIKFDMIFIDIPFSTKKFKYYDKIFSDFSNQNTIVVISLINEFIYKVGNLTESFEKH